MSGKFFDNFQNFVSSSPLSFSKKNFFCFWKFVSVLSEFTQNFAHFPDKKFAGRSNFHTKSQTVLLIEKGCQKLYKSLLFILSAKLHNGLWAKDLRKRFCNIIVQVLWKTLACLFQQNYNCFCKNFQSLK